MALLAPFRALRPAPSVAGRVAAVPYDVVTTAEARALAAGNPLSFLHVSRAEIDLPEGTDPFSEDVYARAASNFRRLRAQAPLVVEEAPALYAYRLQMGRHSQVGLAATYSIDEYDTGLIKRHEYTRRDKEDDRTKHLLELRAQTGPVFLVYRTQATIEELVHRVTAGAPLYDFTAADDVRHTVWRVDHVTEQGLVSAFREVTALYIADGHHRAASAARARKELAGSAGARGDWDRFLAVGFPDTDVQILAYNRVVQDLAGLSPAEFLAALRARFTVSEGRPIPHRRGELSMFLDEKWHSIDLGEPSDAQSPAERLDVARLQESVLGPLLGIGDVRTDKRIDFVGGARGPDELEARVRSGAAAVAFSLHPVEIQDLMAIADSGGIMPPKSTWFEPKLRDGLLSHLV